MSDANTAFHEGFMREAIAQARNALERGDRPSGAVLVCENRIVAGESDTTLSDASKISHPILKLGQANAAFLTARAQDCVLYCTFQPCIMCLGVISHFGISHVYFGSGSKIDPENLQLTLKTYQSGILEAECTQLLKEKEARIASRGPDGFFLPSDRHIFLVSGAKDVPWFLEGGKRAAASIRDSLSRAGVDIDSFSDILDFGCGCGRVVRQWHGLKHARVHGSDYNPDLISWCKRNLEFARFSVNSLQPPLDYPGASFDLVYCLSVFTHWTEGLQHAWMRELHRVIRPGGYLIITTHGARYLGDLTPTDQEAFRAGNLVVTGQQVVGSNDCAAFHPEKYVRERMAEGFDVIEFVPEGSLGTPYQDLYLLRKR